MSWPALAGALLAVSTLTSCVEDVPVVPKTCKLSNMADTADCGRIGGGFSNAACTVQADKACVVRPGTVRFFRLSGEEAIWKQEEVRADMSCNHVKVENPCDEM